MPSADEASDTQLAEGAELTVQFCAKHGEVVTKHIKPPVTPNIHVIRRFIALNPEPAFMLLVRNRTAEMRRQRDWFLK